MVCVKHFLGLCWLNREFNFVHIVRCALTEKSLLLLVVLVWNICYCGMWESGVGILVMSWLFCNLFENFSVILKLSRWVCNLRDSYGRYILFCGSWDFLRILSSFLLIYFYFYRAAGVSSLGGVIRHPSSQVIVLLIPCIGILWLWLLLRGFLHKRLQQILHRAWAQPHLKQIIMVTMLTTNINSYYNIFIVVG